MKNKKAICHAAIFLVLVIVINKLLNFMLIQPGLARTVFYESSKGGYDVIALGASHGTYGVDADELSDTMGGKAINMCARWFQELKVDKASDFNTSRDAK